jgi:hypothetical protein
MRIARPDFRVHILCLSRQSLAWKQLLYRMLVKTDALGRIGKISRSLAESDAPVGSTLAKLSPARTREEDPETTKGRR